MSQTRAQLLKGFQNRDAAADTLVVDSSGRVGIGTTPSFELQVFKNGATSALIVNSNVSTTGLASRVALGNSVGTARLTINMKGGGGEEAYMGTEGNFPMYFQTNGAERCRILAAGGLTFNGDTAAANALDDYEEGTWTPTTAGDSTGVIADASGFYTKVGNLVICSFSFSLTTNFTNSEIGGLPFTPKDIGPNFNGTFLQTTGDRAFIVQNHNSRLTNYKISNGSFPAITNGTRCTFTYLTA